MSDRALLEKRSPADLAALRKRAKSLLAQPDVAALREAHEAEHIAPTLDAIRSGYIIDGYACRWTIGTLALLDIAQARLLGYGDEKVAVTEYDVALALYLIADETRNEAVNVIDSPEELAIAVRRFERGLNMRKVAPALEELLRRIREGTNPGNTRGHRPEGDWWAADIDILQYEYGCSWDYAMWEMPYLRYRRQRDAIYERRTGKRISAARSATLAPFLDALENRDREYVEKLKADEADQTDGA